jgi:hypothetical protein
MMKKMTLTEAIHDLEVLKDDHARIGKVTMEKVIYPLDFLAFARVIVKCCGSAGHDQAASLG